MRARATPVSMRARSKLAIAARTARPYSMADASGTRTTFAPRMAGWAGRLGHTGTTTTTSSPASTSSCIAVISAVTPDEVTAMRSGPGSPCRPAV